MAVPKNYPPFARALNNKTQEDRLAVLRRQHVDHASWSNTWDVLLDAFEGSGGFLSGGYLWPHPREDADQFQRRQVMARYHNYIETLVDLYVRFIFTQDVKRDSGNDDYNTWLLDVDGAGTHINELLKVYASMALVNGHAGMLVDKTSDAATGPTRADEQARTVARVFTASAITDWRFDGSDLVGVKLVEKAPQTDLLEPEGEGEAGQQYLLWNEDGWVRYTSEGVAVGGDTPELGMVPLVVMRFKPTHNSQMVGRALIGNANIIRALYNRASEQDEVLRGSAFSMLSVEVPAEGDVTQVRGDLGNVVGVAKAIVVKGTVDYKTPSQEVATTLGDNMTYLVTELYRQAHIRFQRDSLAEQSGEAVRLQYTELNEMLQGFAKSMSQAEKEIARAWFAWNSATPEQAQTDFENADVIAEYPDEFFLDDLKSDIEAWAESIQLRLGKTMTAHIRKKAVRRIDPDINPDDLDTIDSEIDAMPEDQNLLGQIPMAPFRPDTGGDGNQGPQNA